MVTEFRGFFTNLQILKPSRKKQRPGDLFVARPADRTYVFGRVIRADALWTLRDPEYRGDDARTNLVYVYDYAVTGDEVPHVPGGGVLTRESLLTPPFFLDRLWWSRGYFQTIANVPLGADDVMLQHCFYDLGRQPDRWFDEYNNQVPEPTGPVHDLALPSIGMIDRWISGGLGIDPVGDSYYEQQS